MRIAFVCADPGIPVFGRKGCTVHVQEVLRAFTRLGASIELFATRFDGHPPADLETVYIHRLPPVLKGDCAAREQAALAANRGLRAALVRAGSFDLVYERYALWSCAGMEYARDLGTTGVLEVNAPLLEEQAEHRSLVDRVSAERVAERVFGAATLLIAVSEEMAAYLIERYPGAGGRLHVVSNGVNPDRFPGGRKPSFPACPGPFTVGFLGNLNPWHGLPILVEAFDLFHRCEPNSRLLIVGDGRERTSLVAELSARGLLEAVHFTGRVTHNEVPGLLASMDVALAPYPQLSHFYFSPLKVYEYMAAGLPVIASRIGQLATLIEDGVNGLLCPPGDAQALAEALDRLRWEPELCARLGQAARATVLRNHTWEAIARRILHLAGLEPASYPHGVEVTG
jgi:glycosyltransferase involved in cell wall biosynthesis